MINKLRKLYLRLDQELACVFGRTYIEKTYQDCFNSGGLDKVITTYCAVTGKLKTEKMYLSPKANTLLKADIQSL